MKLNMRDMPVTLRSPTAQDGASLHRLIRACPPLDENSLYCNLLQCTQFAATSVVAERAGELVAAVTGHLVPGREDTLFIWQVAVHESVRGQGLAHRMLKHILARPDCAAVRFVETTVTASNRASWALFEAFARSLDAALERTALFEQTTHFAGEHETEILARIGPFAAPGQQLRAMPPTDRSMETTV
jgi:L-2,4-diaminobutyric acid acetyltransferase